MAKKKASRASKAKGGDGDAAQAAPAAQAPAKPTYVPVKIPKHVENWVTIDFKVSVLAFLLLPGEYVRACHPNRQCVPWAVRS
jgi:hypothetical protein